MGDSQKKEFEVKKNVAKDGTLQIVGGKLLIKDPQNNGKRAAIHPHPDLIIKVNGGQIEGITLVSAADKVEIIPKETKQQRILHIRTDKKKLSAHAYIEYVASRRIELLDSDEGYQLKPPVKVVEDKPKPYTYSEIMEELKKAKIVYGIQRDAINHLLDYPGEEVQIAQGKAPTTGVHGYIQYLFFQKEKEENQEDINSKVNFRDLHEIPSVKKGEVIAKRIPPVYGEKGINIYGEGIKAKAVKNPTIIAGNNVAVDDKGLQAIALVDGKPSVRGKVLHVFSKHEVSGDVDIKSGNIDFFGDVIIKGDVKEGMRVKAGHNIIVYGSVSGAHLEAGGEIEVRNWVFQSTVLAGAQQALLQKLCNKIATLESLMLRLFKGTVDVLKTLGNSNKPLSVGKIVALVIEKHFKDLSLLLKELKTMDFNKISKIIDDKFMKEMQYFIDKYSVYGVLKIQDLQEVKDDIVLLGRMKETLESQFKQPMNVTVAYCQNATIQTSGDVIITGQGCLNSKIFAGGSVGMKEGTSKVCVFRGGVIQCNKDIRIGEMGSSGGAHTVIQTGRQGKILFNTLYYNCHIQIGEKKKKIEETLHKGMCFRNHKGDIVIHSTS